MEFASKDLLVALISICLTAVIGIIRHQLHRKDEAQEKQIEDLYRKHESDSQKLADLELKIAEHHYQKPDVDKMLDRFKGYFDERFDRLEKAIIAGDRRKSD